MEAKVFYGLKQMPFEKETKYHKLYRSEDTANLKGRLDYLKKAKGIGLFTGSPGTGKTSAIREFAGSLNPSLYKVVYIQMSTVSVIDFYRQLARGLGLEPKFRKSDLFRQVQEVIEYMAKEKKCTPVIVIDEAQYLSTSVFNDLTMLLNFEMDSKNYCILILSGQTSLNTILKKQVHDALRQRIVINYFMEGLKGEEAQEYVDFCMKECGSREKVFGEDAVRAAYNIAGGSIRKLNNLLSKCLIEGANEEKRIIDAEIVMKAHNEVELG